MSYNILINFLFIKYKMIKRTLNHDEREIIRKKNEEFLKYCIEGEGKLLKRPIKDEDKVDIKKETNEETNMETHEETKGETQLETQGETHEETNEETNEETKVETNEETQE